VTGLASTYDPRAPRVDRAHPKSQRYYRRWTSRDDRSLRLSWGSAPLAVLARELGRTPLSTYWRARTLGLTAGPPHGYEMLSAAARRAGYATTTLRKILRAADVTLHVAIGRPTGADRHFHYVDPIAVDDAVAAWLRLAPLEQVARDIGVGSEKLRRGLVRAGYKRPRRKLPWRVDPAIAAELVARDRALASVAAHARRVGVDRVTLSGWLRAAGVLGAKRPGGEVRLGAEVVDAVVAVRKPGSRAGRRRSS